MHTYIHRYIHTYRQTDRQTDIITYIHTDRQTERHRHRYIGRGIKDIQIPSVNYDNLNHKKKSPEELLKACNRQKTLHFVMQKSGTTI